MSKQPPPAPTASAVGPFPTLIQDAPALKVYPAPSHHPTTDHLVGCFGFNGPLGQYFSLYWAVSQNWLVGWFWVKRPFEAVFQSISSRLPKRGTKRKERIDESKNVQTTPTRTYCKRKRPLPNFNQNCRTPRHWKFTQHNRTTRPPRERRQMIEKMYKQAPPAPTVDPVGLCQICRTLRHLKFTKHHRTNRPPLVKENICVNLFLYYA